MKKINLLLPIAGKAQRFIDKDYLVPKPLILADGKHIIDWSLSSIDISECNLIFCVRLDHINNFSIDDILKQKYGDDIKIVVIDHITEGALSTCLLAKEHIDDDNPLVIYTPDTYFLNQQIEQELETIKLNLVSGACTSYDQYQYLIGVIEGMEKSKTILKDIANKYGDIDNEEDNK